MDLRDDEGEMAALSPTGNIKTMTSISAVVKDMLNVLTGPLDKYGREGLLLITGIALNCALNNKVITFAFLTNLQCHVVKKSSFSKHSYQNHLPT